MGRLSLRLRQKSAEREPASYREEQRDGERPGDKQSERL
jgi:hypothetical protein